MDIYDLINAWWETTPSARDYTHYSQAHRTYSRIDHFFVHTSLLPVITSAGILSIPWLDHSPIKMSLSGLWSKPRLSPWRLNAALLNPTIYTVLKKELQAYFQENSSPSMSPAIIWAAHKATIRDKIIQLAARAKQTREQTIKQLEVDLGKLMQEQRLAPQVDIRHRIDEARLALNLSLTTQAEKCICWSRHKYYTMGDKPTTMLARKLVPRILTSTLPKLRLPTRHPTQNPKTIIQEFHKFYTKLYSKPDQYSHTKAEAFLGRFHCLSLQTPMRSLWIKNSQKWKSRWP